MRIPLSRPDVGEREIELVTRVLRSGQLSLGPRLAEFEEKFASYVGSRYAVAVNSGTSALHLCIKALGIGAGHEVLTTSFSFVASANCILYEGAIPAFADIDAARLNLDPDNVSAVIARDYVWKGGQLTNRASGRVLKAILPVHVFGLPCDMAPIRELAQTFNLRVVEDACEALGARYGEQAAGTLGDAGVFAFYPNKQMTTAEGGMIVTNDARLARVCRSLRNQGRDESAAWLRHERLGYNYRLSELHCALGLAQLERIDELLAAREQVALGYARLLSGIPRIALPCDPPDRKRSWFVYVIRVVGPSASSLRRKLIEGLRTRGIACQTYFPAIHLQPYFRGVPLTPVRPLPQTESASDSCVALPFFSSMTSEQTEEVCTAVREIVQRSAGVRKRAPTIDRPPVPSLNHARESEGRLGLR
ncbi:MAG TPA: DegT/DnrJ/EryC1/StrS family aminotransferase [Candidatus Acidoferrales bacterium]|nr:DegT/DnrJ/EryC1/StrS family aminotransferase [Candidatus Acidoferrales bacterium]